MWHQKPFKNNLKVYKGDRQQGQTGVILVYLDGPMRTCEFGGCQLFILVRVVE
jgi:hypothetical protein